MKKLLSVILVGSMLVSLAACGKKEPTSPETEPIATEEVVQDVVSDTPHQVEGKQSFWENIIKKKQYKTQGNSIAISINEEVFIQLLNDDKGRSAYTYTEQQNDNIVGVVMDGIYKENNETIYVREYVDAVVQGQKVLINDWKGLSSDGDANKNALAKLFNIPEVMPGVQQIEQEMKNLSKVEYLQTVNGKDELRIHCTIKDESDLPVEPSSDAIKVMEYSLYEVEMDGEKGVLVYVSEELPLEIEYPEEEEKDPDETTEPVPQSYTDHDAVWVKEPSWAKTNQCAMDLLNKKVIVGDKEIAWTLKQDLQKQPERTITTYIDMTMDATHQAVCKMSMTTDDISIVVEYFTCDSAIDVLEMPFFIEEHVPAKQVSDNFWGKVNNAAQY